MIDRFGKDVRRARWLVSAAVLALGVTAAPALVVSDRPAAILTFPYIVADAAGGADTLIQISNQSAAPAAATCFYENATAHCALGGAACSSGAECDGNGDCLPGWSVTTFSIAVSTDRPVAWRASAGGDAQSSGSSPDGVPALPENPFVGALRCVVTDGTGRASGDNVLIGTATLERVTPSPDLGFAIAKYNAIGIEGINGDANADGQLALGGDAGEFAGCPNFLVYPSFSNGAADPVSEDTVVETMVVLVPCAVDYSNTEPAEGALQYIFFDEFRLRVDAVGTFGPHTVVSPPGPLCAQPAATGSPDPSPSPTPEHLVSTLTYQGRIHPVESGLIGLAIEVRRRRTDDALVSFSARNLAQQGDREGPDVLALPGSNPARTETASASVTPSITPTPSTTPTATATAADSASATATPTTPETPPPSLSATPTLNATGTATATFTVGASETPTLVPTFSATATVTSSATSTPTPGGCCEVGAGGGCREAACSACVCDVDSSCCDDLWDASCVEVAGSTCNAACRCAGACVGDCNANGTVAINELILAVRIALESAPLTECISLDTNNSGAVEVNELISAVNRALNGCGPSP